MQTDIEKLQTKSAFMMAALCEEQAKFKGEKTKLESVKTEQFENLSETVAGNVS